MLCTPVLNGGFRALGAAVYVVEGHVGIPDLVYVPVPEATIPHVHIHIR